MLQFWHLPLADKSLLIRVAMLLVTTIVGLRILPFRFVCRLISSFRSHGLRRRRDVDPPVEKVIWAVNLLSSRIPAATCLAKALTTLALLGRYGQPGSLRFAVAKSTNGKLEAHAWVENERRVLIGELSDLSRFVVLSPSKDINL